MFRFKLILFMNNMVYVVILINTSNKVCYYLFLQKINHTSYFLAFAAFSAALCAARFFC